jgi:hypothetical protein
MLPTTEPTRKQRFNASLDLAGWTLQYWRTEVYPVSHQHINEVLNGERDGGPELNAAIDGLIGRFFTLDAA